MKCLLFIMLYSSCITNPRSVSRESSSKAVGKTHLAGGVNYLCRELLAFVFDNLAECVFDCRIVALDKVAVDELYRKRGLACVVASVLQSQVASM